MNTQKECCDEPRGFVGGVCDFCGGEVQPEPTDTPEIVEQTLKLQHRLLSKNPRVVGYNFNDRPNEVFSTHKLLQEHRGFTDEQMRQTVTIL
jgi:hypothetical protein